MLHIALASKHLAGVQLLLYQHIIMTQDIATQVQDKNQCHGRHWLKTHKTLLPNPWSPWKIWWRMSTDKGVARKSGPMGWQHVCMQVHAHQHTTEVPWRTLPKSTKCLTTTLDIQSFGRDLGRKRHHWCGTQLLMIPPQRHCLTAEPDTIMQSMHLTFSTILFIIPLRCPYPNPICQVYDAIYVQACIT